MAEATGVAMSPLPAPQHRRSSLSWQREPSELVVPRSFPLGCRGQRQGTKGTVGGRWYYRWVVVPGLPMVVVVGGSLVT